MYSAFTYEIGKEDYISHLPSCHNVRVHVTAYGDIWLTQNEVDDATRRCGPNSKVDTFFQYGLSSIVYCCSSMSTEMVNTSLGGFTSYAWSLQYK